MIKSYERPVGYDTRDTLASLEIFPYDKVLDSSCIHHHDVWHCQDFREDGGCEQCSVLHNDKGTLVLERYAKLGKEAVGGFAHNLQNGW